VDERFDLENSNYLQFKKEYADTYKRAIASGIVSIDTSPKKNTQYEMAQWYEYELTRYTEQCKAQDGRIIGLMGIGEDGHTASLFPHPESETSFYNQFVDTEKKVIGIDATGKNQHTKRFTLTIKGLEEIDEFITFISGEKKQQCIEDIEQYRLPMHAVPASYLWYTQKPCTLFIS
jgi:6-phosphogluconolactonase/glucosamine-6-phosphate isomerase/deaminase